MSQDDGNLKGIINNQNVRFIPFNILRDVAKAVTSFESKETNSRRSKLDRKPNCSKSLIDLRDDCNSKHMPNRFAFWEPRFNRALRNAVHKHDWDKLLKLFLMSPISDYNHKDKAITADNYLRSVIILLLNHPNAQENETLFRYFHLVLSCRTDKEKMDLARALLAVPKKLPSRNKFRQGIKEWDDDSIIIDSD